MLGKAGQEVPQRIAVLTLNMVRPISRLFVGVDTPRNLEDADGLGYGRCQGKVVVVSNHVVVQRQRPQCGENPWCY